MAGNKKTYILNPSLHLLIISWHSLVGNSQHILVSRFLLENQILKGIGSSNPVDGQNTNENAFFLDFMDEEKHCL